MLNVREFLNELEKLSNNGTHNFHCKGVTFHNLEGLYWFSSPFIKVSDEPLPQERPFIIIEDAGKLRYLYSCSPNTEKPSVFTLNKCFKIREINFDLSCKVNDTQEIETIQVQNSSINDEDELERLHQDVVDALTSLPETPHPLLFPWQGGFAILAGLKGSGKSTLLAYYAYIFRTLGYAVALFCPEEHPGLFWRRLKVYDPTLQLFLNYQFFRLDSQIPTLKEIKEWAIKNSHNNLVIVLCDTGGMPVELVETLEEKSHYMRYTKLLRLQNEYLNQPRINLILVVHPYSEVGRKWNSLTKLDPETLKAVLLHSIPGGMTFINACTVKAIMTPHPVEPQYREVFFQTKLGEFTHYYSFTPVNGGLKVEKVDLPPVNCDYTLEKIFARKHAKDIAKFLLTQPEGALVKPLQVAEAIGAPEARSQVFKILKNLAEQGLLIHDKTMGAFKITSETKALTYTLKKTETTETRS